MVLKQFFSWPMILLMACSLVSVSVIVERLLVLLPLRRRTREFIARVTPLVREGGAEKAAAAIRGADVPLARILEPGIRRAGDSPEALAAAFQNAAAVEIPPLHTRLWLLAALAQVSTLLGLLGTVVGMISAFHAVQERGLAGQIAGPGDLAGGLWISLLCTAAGLLIAIPSYFAFYALGGWVNALTTDMERCAHDVGQALAGRRGAAS